MKNDKFPKYDLEERTAKFGEEVMSFAKTIKSKVSVEIKLRPAKLKI